MDIVYALSPKGQRECAAERPALLRELHDLLRMVDGRRTRTDLLSTVGKNAITTGGLRWLTASGYIYPKPPDAPHGAESSAHMPELGGSPQDLPASVPQDLSTRSAPVSARGEARVRDALAQYMQQSIERHLGDAGAPYRRRVERATSVGELLPLLNPLLEAILARVGSAPAIEFADAAALLLQPLEQRALN